MVLGQNPIIPRIISFSFVKIIFMLISKFFIQSYFLVLVVKSFLYNYIYEYQFNNLKLSEMPPDFQLMVETYYKGLCVQSSHQTEKQFCYTETLSFTQATIYAPMIILMLTYLPTILYAGYIRCHSLGLG